LKKLIGQQNFGIELISHPHLDHYLDRWDKEHLSKLAERSHAQIRFSTNDAFHLNDFAFFSTITGKKLDV